LLNRVGSTIETENPGSFGRSTSGPSTSRKQSICGKNGHAIARFSLRHSVRKTKGRADWFPEGTAFFHFRRSQGRPVRSAHSLEAGSVTDSARDGAAEPWERISIFRVDDGFAFGNSTLSTPSVYSAAICSRWTSRGNRTLRRNSPNVRSTRW
jgi:hypothetical protein